MRTPSMAAEHDGVLPLRSLFPASDDDTEEEEPPPCTEQPDSSFEEVFPVPDAAGKDGADARLQHIVIRQEGHKGLTFKLWPAAFALCRFLSSRWGPADAGEREHRGLPRRVLELGSGTGLVGIFVGAAVRDCSVVLSDLPCALELLADNVRENEKRGVLPAGRVVVDALCWGKQEDVARFTPPCDLSYTGRCSCRRFDVILGSDLVYWQTLFEPLASTILTLCRWQERWHPPAPVVILAQQKRWKTEGRFWKRMAKHFEVKVASQEDCAESRRVVTVYEATLRRPVAPPVSGAGSQAQPGE